MQHIAQDLRSYLQAELIRRCKGNPKYSLRAFSRSLGLESSFLSKVLKGSRNITPKLIDRLGEKLALDPREIERFKSTAAHKPVEYTSSPVIDYHQLTYDSFQVISDWYHYAILELLTVKDFQFESRWIARKLSITPTEVDAAIERMKRLGLIKLDSKGNLVQVPNSHTTVGAEYSASALKKLQRQILEMALLALEETPIEERDQSAMTMAIDSSQLPEAKKRIRDFRRGLCSFLQSKSKRDRVYHLSISLYPVSRKAKSQ